MFKTGDIVKCIEVTNKLTYNKKYKVISADNDNVRIVHDEGVEGGFFPHRFILTKGNHVISTFKEYLNENRQVLMAITIALVVDHLVFEGAFRKKIKSLVDGLLNKAQKHLDT